MNPTDSIRRIDTAVSSSVADAVAYSRHISAASVRWFGFWAAILLPLVYLPLLVASSGLGIALLGCQLIAVVIGHNHTPTSNDP